MQDQGALYNRGLYITQGRILSWYDKVRLFDWEKKFFQIGGKPIGVFTYKDLKVATQICLDIIDPVPMAQLIKNSDISLLLVPSAISVNYLLPLIKARALENQLIAIFCNRSRIKGENPEYLGCSTIFYPDGTEKRVSAQEEGVFLTSISQSDIQQMVEKRRLLGI